MSTRTATLTGGRDTYWACQLHARRLRARGALRVAALSAALLPGGAGGRQIVGGSERPARRQDGRVIVVFGDPDGLVGWKAVERGAPPDVLPRVRHFAKRGAAAQS